ncbi:MAG: hypothetical protein HYW48_00345 [Deltaproteobacteria bacterium]|nr:hypothetical protein [Deltaproteobacteria bacterium]
MKFRKSSLLAFTVIFPVWLSAGTISTTEREGLIESFPCQDCHDKIGLKKERKKESPPPSHTRIEFSHMRQVKDCQLCHNPENLNTLITLDGRTVSFNQSYEQCVNCHGEKGRDWDLGIHGKQVGSWQGDKTRLNCTDCHNPHKPKFPEMTPLPPPPFPKFGIRKKHEP